MRCEREYWSSFHVLGSSSKKEHMIASAQKHWPGWSGCDNEADARWVAVCGMDEMTKNAREVLG